MTTIATDGVTIAADSQVTGCGQIVGDVCKVRRAQNGDMFATTGPSDEGILFAQWLDGGGDKPDLSEEFCAVILTKSGDVQWVGKKLVRVPCIVPYANGSGGDIALGAMLAGASPIRAVEIAALRDTCTGGPVNHMSIQESILAAA